MRTPLLQNHCCTNSWNWRRRSESNSKCCFHYSSSTTPPQRRTASQPPNDYRIRPLFESVKPLELLSNSSHTTLEKLSNWHFHWHRRDWLSNALVGAFLEPTTPVFTVRGQLIAESSWVEQGNHIHRCNKLDRNHPAFASFGFLESTG